MSLPLPALLTSLRDLPAIVEAYVDRIPADRLDLRRTPEAWTLREHVYHIAGVQALLLGRMTLLRDAPEPEVVPYFPQDEPALADKFPSLEAAFAEYRSRRGEQLAVLASVKPADWTKPARHPEYEQYNLELVVHHLVFHEYWHAYRIEELWLTRDAYLT